MQLIEQLMENLGVTEEQARGGAGMLLKTAKEQLGSQFGAVSEAIPEADTLMDEAPNVGAEEDSDGLLGALGDLGGSLGGLGDSLGGSLGGNLTEGLGGMMGNLGNIGSLLGGFQKLGLDASMLQKFVPEIMKYAENLGGGGIKDILSKVLG